MSVEEDTWRTCKFEVVLEKVDAEDRFTGEQATLFIDNWSCGNVVDKAIEHIVELKGSEGIYWKIVLIKNLTAIEDHSK